MAGQHLAHLEASGSCPMRCDDLSHSQKWLLALVCFWVNRMSLSLVTATSRVVSSPCGVAGVSSPVELQSLDRVIWRISSCPYSRLPLSTQLVYPRERHKSMQLGTRSVAGVARVTLNIMSDCLRNSVSGFDFGVDSPSLPINGSSRKEAEV